MAVKERSNNQWLAALRGPNRDEALADLRVLLMRGLRGALGGQANRADSSVEDFAQEALIKILGNLDSFRGECRFTTWAHKICVRTALLAVLDVWVDTGSANPTFETLFADHHLDVPVATAGDHFTVQTDAVFETAPLATMEIFTDRAGTGCAAVTHLG